VILSAELCGFWRGGRPATGAAPLRRSKKTPLFFIFFSIPMYYLSLFSFLYPKVPKEKTINLDLERHTKRKKKLPLGFGFEFVIMIVSVS